jgi:hypothetical protein
MSFKLDMSIDKRYKNGKIYKIVSDKTDMIYIGSTITTLNTRLSNHKVKNTNSKEIFEIDSNPKIILLEEYPCRNKRELETRERYYIENNDCINKNIPTRSKEESKKEYRNNHKEYNKEYYTNHIEEIKEYRSKKYTCVCGVTISICNKAKHLKSKFHIYYTNNQCLV